MQKASVLNQSCRAPRKAGAAPSAIASVDAISVAQTVQQLRRRARHVDTIAPAAVLAEPEAAEVRNPAEPALDAIAEEALIASRADGAAIALELGSTFECCARAGVVAPAIGTPLDTNAGLSGECFRTGKIASTNDAELDPRIDIAVCRQAGIRSVMIVPVCSLGRVTGMLSVFSLHVAAFGPRELSRLQALAASVSELSSAANVPEQSDDEQEPAAVHGGAILPLQKRPAAPEGDATIGNAEQAYKPSTSLRACAGSREIDRCLEAIRQDPALRVLGHVKTYLRIENLYDGDDRSAAIEICDRLIMERGAEIGAGLKMADVQSPAR